MNHSCICYMIIQNDDDDDASDCNDDDEDVFGPGLLPALYRVTYLLQKRGSLFCVYLVRVTQNDDDNGDDDDDDDDNDDDNTPQGERFVQEAVNSSIYFREVNHCLCSPNTC